MQVLAVVDTTQQGDFGGMRVLLGHQKGVIYKGWVQVLEVEEK